MISKETIKSFAAMELAVEHNGSPTNRDQAFEMISQAERRGAEYAAKMPYDKLCDHIKDVVSSVHEKRIPGVGKLHVLARCALEDPERFSELLDKVRKDEGII